MMIGFGNKIRYQAKVVNIFNEKYPHLPPLSQEALSKIYKQYRELGHIKPLPRKPHVIDENVKLSVQRTLTSSLHPRLCDVSHITVLRCVKIIK